jgi:Ni/Co efflux regulator RcnB
MNKLVVSLVFSAFAMSAFAQSQTSMPAQSSVAVSVQGQAGEVTVVSAKDDKTVDRKCMRETGSHIVRKDKRACVNAPGDSYSREDIDRTGARDVADALRLLDPSVR